MYTFELNIGSLSNPSKGGGYITVSVFQDGNGLVKAVDDEYFGVIRKKLSKELLFADTEYVTLKKLYDDGEINIEIKIYLNSVEKFYGYLLLDGNWDDNKKTCSLMTQVVDEYSVLLNNLDVEQNIIEYADNTIKIKRFSYVQAVTLPCYNGNLTEAKRYYDPDGNVSADPGSTNADWNYYQYLGEETGCASGFHAYKFSTLEADFAAPGYTASVIYSNLWLKAGTVGETILTSINRAAKLYDILEALLYKADSTINISESTYSDYINDTNNDIYNLYIMDKSDVKRNAESGATFQNMTLETLLKIYYEWFDLSFKLDSSNNFYLIRKEAKTEANYTTYPANDLTTYKSTDFTSNQRQYTTNVENKTSKEIFKFEEVTGTYFVKSELNYALYFDNVKDYSFLNFNNNVVTLVDDWEEANDDGFTMFACDSSDNIINKDAVSGGSIINGAMTAQRIMYDHKRDNKPFQTGKLDNISVTLTRENDREVLYKNIPIYDIDLINFDYLVKTAFGLMEVKEFGINFSGDFGYLTMVLNNEFAGGLLYEKEYLYSPSLALICDELDPPSPVTVYNTEDSHISGKLYANQEGTIVADIGYYKTGTRYYYFNGSSLSFSGICT